MEEESFGDAETALVLALKLRLKLKLKLKSETDAETLIACHQAAVEARAAEEQSCCRNADRMSSSCC